MRGKWRKVLAGVIAVCMLAPTVLPQRAGAAEKNPIELNQEINKYGFLNHSAETAKATVHTPDGEVLEEIRVYKDGEELELGMDNLDKTVYYVDAVEGNDDNDGLSPAQAWRSIEKVNQTTYQPNTGILFKCGQAWSGNLVASSSGTEGKPITYSSYGEGSKPLINGIGDINDGLIPSTAAVLIKDKEFVEVTGLAITNLGKKADGTPNDVEELGLNEGLRSGIIVAGTRGVSKEMRGIRISDNEIYNVKGSTDRYPTNSPYGMYHNAGIFVWLEGTKGDAAYFDGLDIENNLIRDMSCQGINFNVEDAGYYNFQHDRYNQNVVLRGNSIARTGADAIVVEYCNKVLVERNVGYNAGEKTDFGRPSVIAGIWQSNVNDPVFQYNECARTRFFRGDGMAWDMDWGSGGTSVYQYNYSHENEGGMMMDCAFSSPNYKAWIMRYNLSVNEPGAQWTVTSNYVGNIHFYNNTVYLAPGAGSIYLNEGRDIKNYYKNNIFVADEIRWNNSKSDFNTNLIWGHGNDVSFPQNAQNTYIADPKFVDTSAAQITELKDKYKPILVSPGSLDGFDKTKGWQLQSDSPAINRGIVVEDNGGRDLFDNDIYYGEPDIGANEFQGEYTGDGAVEKLPVNGSSGIEAELYDSTDSSTIRIEVMDGKESSKYVTGFRDQDSLNYEKVLLDKSVQSIGFLTKSAQDVEVKVTVGDISEIFRVSGSVDFQKQVYDFQEEIAPGMVQVSIQVLGEGADTFAIDKFSLTPLAAKPYDTPFIFTFEEDAQSWVPVGTGSVQTENGKLKLENKDNKEFYIAERAPVIQDGITEFQMTMGENAKSSVIVRYNREESKYIEVGTDTAGSNYWFIDGTYDGISHTQFDSKLCPIAVPGKTYAIKIKMDGSHFTVWIDGVLVSDLDFEGLELSAGGIGACKWNYKSVTLDNIRVNSGTIKGRVVGKNGLGVGNVSMSLDHGYASIMTDSQGYYEFEAPVEWGKTYVISGHAATGNLEEKEAVTSADQDVAEVNFELDAEGADKEELNEWIAKAGELLDTDYSEESWNELTKALEKANGVAGNINAVQSEIEVALGELKDAIGALEKLLLNLPHLFTFENSLEGIRGLNDGSAAEIMDGKLKLKDTNRKGKWIAGSLETFADGIVEYEFTPIPPDGFIGGKAAMMLRVDETGNSFVEVGVDSLNLDYWFIAGEGINGNQVFSDAPVLIPGQTYKVKIQFEGEHVTVWIDETEVFNQDLPGMKTAAGTIGMHTWDTTEVLFDNVSVSAGEEAIQPANWEQKKEEAEDEAQKDAVMTLLSTNKASGKITKKEDHKTFAKVYDVELDFRNTLAGNYRIVAQTVSRKEYTLEFKIDKAAPVIKGAEHNKQYSKPVLVQVYDENILSATLNGKPFDQEITAVGPGRYTVQVRDKAENMTEINFTIVKEVMPPTDQTIKVTGIKTGTAAKNMKIKESYRIPTEVLPDNATNKSVTYSSDNKNVAVVSGSGVVTAKKAGTANITVKANDGSGKLAVLRIRVKTPVIKMNVSTLPLQTGKTTSVIKLKSSDVKGEKIKSAKSSNKKIVQVKIKKGKLYVTAQKNKGSAYVTVKSTNGGAARVNIRVQKSRVKTKKLYISKSKVTLKKGKRITLKVTRNPLTANEAIKWSATGKGIVSVRNGKVIAKKKGKANVIATSSNGKKVKCRITVE